LYEKVECFSGLLRGGRPLRCSASGQKRLPDDCHLHTVVSLRPLAHQRCIPDMLVGLAVLIIAPVSTLLILPPRVSVVLLLANAGITGPALAAHLAGGGLSSAPALCLAAATAVATGAVVSLRRTWPWCSAWRTHSRPGPGPQSSSGGWRRGRPTRWPARSQVLGCARQHTSGAGPQIRQQAPCGARARSTASKRTLPRDCCSSKRTRNGPARGLPLESMRMSGSLLLEFCELHVTGITTSSCNVTMLPGAQAVLPI